MAGLVEMIGLFALSWLKTFNQIKTNWNQSNLNFNCGMDWFQKWTKKTNAECIMTAWVWISKQSWKERMKLNEMKIEWCI